MKSHCFDRNPVLHYLLVLFMLLSTNLHGLTYTVLNGDQLDDAISDATGDDMEDTIVFAADIVLDEPLWQILMGDETLTIEGNGHTLSRNPTAPTFRILAVVGGTVTINNLTITGGHSDSYSGDIVDGGGISNQSSMLTLNNCTISGNKAQGNGGGISNRLGVFGQPSSVTLNNCTISGNTALGNTALGNTANGGNGAGIFNESGEMTLNNCTVSGNTAQNNGAGVFNESGETTLNNCTVSNNLAQRFGGGIYQNDGTLTLIRSIVSGNSAHGEQYETHEGDELYKNAGSINANAHNVLGHDRLSDEHAFEGFIPGATDITCTWDGDYVIDLQFILSPLADNGGPTLTHALGEWSPAVDIAPVVTDGDNPTPFKDQRGISRPQGSGVDAGAYEYVSDPSMTVDLASLDFSEAGSTQDIALTANVSWTASVDDGSIAWLSLSHSSGTGDATVSVSAAANTGPARSGTVTFTSTGLDSIAVAVTQAAAPNRAPRLRIIGNKTVKAGQPITFQVIADDEDDNVLQYSATHP